MAASPYQFSDELNSSGSGPEMIFIPSGEFVMGDQEGKGAANEGPVHEVTLDKPFAVAKYEVTVNQFEAFVEATGYVTDAELGNSCYTVNEHKQWRWVEGANWRDPGFEQGADHPVVCVSWRDATEYTRWLSEQSGEVYRLPTEAEWEYVARAGTDTPWFWGKSDDCQSANCCTGTLWVKKKTREAGAYAANNFGIHDTAGNAWEWTASAYTENYDGSELRSTPASDLATRKVVRGGSWYRFEDFSRSSARGSNWAQSRYSDVGFRVVRDVSPALAKKAEQNLKLNLSQAD